MPFAIEIVLTMFISYTFVGLLNSAILGTLVCLGVDIDLNNGTPQSGPPDLHRKLDEAFDIDKDLNDLDGRN
jgi:hypothetical protein